MNDWSDETVPLIELIRREVDELSLDHHDHVWQDKPKGKPGRELVKLRRKALITQIREAIYGDLGRTQGGATLAREKNLIDMGAFTTYEDITGRIEAHYRFLTGDRPSGLAEHTIRQWFIAFNNGYRANKYNETVLRRTLYEVRGWARRIKTHFDPPRVKDLIGPCPIEGCEATEVEAKDHSKQTALFVSYKADEQPIVRCRSCGTFWEGQFALWNLGKHLGANTDEDALREMGVDVDGWSHAA